MSFIVLTDYPTYYCDACGKYSDREADFIKTNGQHYCEACHMPMSYEATALKNKWKHDCRISRCVSCGREEYVNRLVKGRCEKCIK